MAAHHRHQVQAYSSAGDLKSSIFSLKLNPIWQRAKVNLSYKSTWQSPVSLTTALGLPHPRSRREQLWMNSSGWTQASVQWLMWMCKGIEDATPRLLPARWKHNYLSDSNASAPQQDYSRHVVHASRCDLLLHFGGLPRRLNMLTYVLCHISITLFQPLFFMIFFLIFFTYHITT